MELRIDAHAEIRSDPKVIGIYKGRGDFVHVSKAPVGVRSSTRHAGVSTSRGVDSSAMDNAYIVEAHDMWPVAGFSGSVGEDDMQARSDVDHVEALCLRLNILLSPGACN